MLDFRMETFLKVCECMNFTRAAEELNLTQPAVSQHIKYLEEKYETPLFLHDKKSISLTPAGELLCSTLRTMRNDENTLKKRMKKSMLNKHTVTFGVTMTIGEYAIVPALADFIKNYPETEFNVRYGNTQTLLSYLYEGSIDFAIVEGYFKAENYCTRVLKNEEYIAVSSSNHRFKNPINSLKDLVNERLIIRERGSGTRAILTKTLSVKNMSVNDFKNIVEIENIHTIVNLLCRDCGISFLYKSAVKDEIEKGILKQIKLSDFSVTHDFTFLWNKNSLFSDEYERIFCKMKNYVN